MCNASANGLTNLASPGEECVFIVPGDRNTVGSNDFCTLGTPAINIANGTDNRLGDFSCRTLQPSFNPSGIDPLPIDLNSNGIRDPNDLQDPDGGANRTQNYPVNLKIHRLGPGLIELSGSLNSTPNSTFQISLYEQDHYRGADGIEQVRTYSTGITGQVSTDTNGNATITVLYSGESAFRLLIGDHLTATATRVTQSPITAMKATAEVDVLGDTSEMSLPAVVPKPQFDFDEDGKADLVVYRPGATAGALSFWYVLNSGDLTFRIEQFGSGEDRSIGRDFQGDGVADFAVWRPSNGTWYHSRITGNPATNFAGIQWGLPTDIPVPGDYDDDGANDAAVFRPSEGNWYIRSSIDGSSRVQNFGLATDKLVPADYDGDGDTDIAVYRDGTWYISVCPVCPVRYERFGLPNDIPVPTDYDGDGVADIAIWRPAGGQWWISKSTGGIVVYQWGVSTDVPVNGDFDADGKKDIAIWRPSTGDWWILRSSDASSYVVHWGQNGDIPVSKFANAP
jgi:hypothetical protein